MAWFYGRSALREQISAQMASLAQDGLEVSCGDLSIAGYPFRYEVYCRDLVSRDRAGARASLGELTAVALIYNPRHVIFEAKAPANLLVPLNGLAGTVGWQTARASMKFSGSALGELDAVVSAPDATLENAASAGSFAAEKLEAHMREAPDSAGTLEGFLSLTGLQLKSLPQLAEPIALRAQARIADGTALLSGGSLAGLVQANDGELPVKLVLFDAGLGESRLNASGNLVLYGDGTLSGKLNVAVANANSLLEKVTPLFPPQDTTPALLESALKSLEPSAKEVDGVSTIKLPVMVDHGLVRLGLLPLGRIPPLFQAGT